MFTAVTLKYHTLGLRLPKLMIMGCLITYMWLVTGALAKHCNSRALKDPSMEAPVLQSLAGKLHMEPYSTTWVVL